MFQKSPKIGQCLICLSNLNKSNIYAISKCGHTFHQKCIRQWISSANNCPTCRTNAFQSDIIKLFIQENNFEIVIPKKEELLPCIEEEAATRREQRRQRVAERLGIVFPKKEEILPYIETKYNGFFQRIMKECECEITRYETGELKYKCLKDFDIKIWSHEKTGNIRIIFPNEITIQTNESKRLDIILEKTNEKCIVDRDGIRFEHCCQRMRNGRKEFFIKTEKTFRSNEGIVEQDKNRIKFYFPKFTIKRYLKNGENGEVTIRVY